MNQNKDEGDKSKCKHTTISDINQDPRATNYKWRGHFLNAIFLIDQNNVGDEKSDENFRR